MTVDPLAAEGFTEGAAAYERGRPEYAPEAVSWCCEELGLDGASRVLDLGAGTGKLTRGLVGRVREVVGVEPLDAMRAELERAVPAAVALAGTAEAIPLADGSVDAAFSGTAFHWFALEPTLAELRRVLVPDGGFATLWNVDEWDGAWATPLGEAIARHRDPRDHPWLRRPMGTFDEQMLARTDVETVSRDFSFVREVTRAQLVDHVSSMSFIGALEPDARAAALADAARVLEEHGEERLSVPYRCVAHVTRFVPTS